ncbi:MAG TPA: DUF2867 domain-containing protein [Burkholderiales bacterium]|nr:DUF2867 domain-containing protein [Burkholderiales bacterium]
MFASTKVVRTFPSARIPSVSGGLPVEVSLIAQLGHGCGDQLFESVMARQQGHESFIDELDEPSARLAGVDVAKGDATSLYSFGVGAKGHPFHRHAGHRVFTAVSGSGGAQLRFSSASPEQIERDPHAFMKALRYIDIPPDSLFTVRFGGDTWHQFAPLSAGSKHPAFFALSCHTNELGGALTEATRHKVLSNQATIPLLTELLPPSVVELLKVAPIAANDVPTIALSLDAPAGSLQSKFCAAFRSMLGRLRAIFGRWRGAIGFLSDTGSGRRVEPLDKVPEGSLLREEFPGRFHHEDTFRLATEPNELTTRSASKILAALLEGFLENRPAGVSRLMRLRNALVTPLGLRTSPLGCPVSSLLCRERTVVFADRFPVIAQSIDPGDRRAQVILGADDKHLRFRSCAGVEVRPDGTVVFALGTRVQFKNVFGRFYMAAIDAVHRGYVTPAMLRLAADHAVRTLS